MKGPTRTFNNFDEINAFIQKKGKGHILLEYRNMSDYAGMVQGMGIIFNTDKAHYELDVQWISFGLDLFGENLLENYLYRFDNLQALLDYLHSTYAILVTDIPLDYKIDQRLFPDPIKNSAEKPEFEATWQKFQDDFKKGLFLDEALALVFSSNSSHEI